MRTLILVVAVVQTVLGGGSHFAVRLPFLNPAGVTYVDGPAPNGLAAGPVGYAASEPALAAEVGYGAAPGAVGYATQAIASAPEAISYAAHEAGSYAAPAAVGYATQAVAAAPAAVGYAAPAAVGYAAPAAVGYAAPAAVGYAAPAAVGYAAPAAVGYAAAPVHTVAAVPTVHHVPGVADVPVTRVEAQPGVIQKVVDVAKPALSTRKFQLRRPAIQSQFYDIEERVVVRPAGSALVELEEPHSKIQKGPAIINPIGQFGVASGPFQPAPIAVATPVAVAPTPIAVAPSPQPVFVSTTPAPVFGPAPGQGPVALQDEESVVVDNPEFQARASLSAEGHQLEAEQRSLNAQQQELESRQQDLHSRRQHLSRTHTEARPLGPSSFPGIGGPHARVGPSVEVRTNGAPLDLVPHSRSGPEIVPSLRSSPEVNQANQQRLIQLLSAQGGVFEAGFGREGPSPPPVGDAGFSRGRVLSATAAPPHSEPAGERVSTRRVVVSRPIETLQDIDVVEPVTKLERISVNHPTVFKTVHHDVARVPTSVPVLGKTLTPAIAQAAVPVGLGVGVGPVGYYH